MPNNFRQVILVHPNIDRLATPIPTLLTRFNNYGEMLQFETVDQTNKLVLVLGIKDSSFNSIDEKLYPAIRILRFSSKKSFPIIFSFKLILHIKTQLLIGEKCTVIAGDLRAAVLPMIASKIFFKKKVRTQISFHGTPSNIYNQKVLKKFIVGLIIRLAVRFADSIRVVSRHLEIEVLSKFNNSKDKTFVAPIPILENAFEQTKIQKVHKSVVVLGRLHPERGILELLNFLEKPLKASPDIHLTIAGDGPLMPKVKKWALSLGLKNQVSILGNLQTREAIQLLSQSHILVSNALHEGFGMAIREAALQGCLIVARRNPGTQTLAETFGNCVSLYESENEFVLVLQNALRRKANTDNLSELERIQGKIDIASKEKLISSWLNDR
jgi:glycosyltransferase involved in cell wall biosynthesis